MERALRRRGRRGILGGLLLALLAPLAGAAPAQDGGIPRTPAPEGAALYIISPAHGETLSSPLKVRFGLSHAGVAPAGVRHATAGHHHLILDAPLPPLDAPIPADANHLHFGGGQTETVLELEPGRHTLQLVLGDHDHVPHDPPIVSEQIEIRVE